MGAGHKYPFSVAKHGDDIVFMRDETARDMREIESGAVEVDGDRYSKLCALHVKLSELVDTINSEGGGRVVMLTGEQIGLAKKAVADAAARRGY